MASFYLMRSKCCRPWLCFLYLGWVPATRSFLWFRRDRNVENLVAFSGDPTELQFGRPWKQALILSRVCRIPACNRRGLSLCLPVSCLLLLSLVRGKLLFWISGSLNQAWIRTRLVWLSLRLFFCYRIIFPRWGWFECSGLPCPLCWTCSSPLLVGYLLGESRWRLPFPLLWVRFLRISDLRSPLFRLQLAGSRPHVSSLFVAVQRLSLLFVHGMVQISYESGDRIFFVESPDAIMCFLALRALLSPTFVPLPYYFHDLPCCAPMINIFSVHVSNFRT